MTLNLINKLNINQLKIFESVYRKKSMTLAAQELFLTQSGVSQHMKAFEDSLGFTLFVRNRSMLYATEEADRLYKTCLKCFEEIEGTLHLLKGAELDQVGGVIRIGVPTEFGNNVVLPFLSEWARKNSLIKFDIVYGYGVSLIEQLEKGELDMAFIDSLEKNKKIASKVVFKESLNLVASEQYLKDKKISVKAGKENIKDLLALDFVDYDHKESILRLWFRYHYNKKNLGLNIKAWAMNVQGIASLVKQGMGTAVLPNHLTEKLLKQGVGLHVFKGAKNSSLQNEISLAWLKEKPHSKAADLLLAAILQKSL